MTIAGLVLAGGLSRRMGGREKALLPLNNRPMIEHVLARLSQQTSTIAINANGDPARFGTPDVDVLADVVPDNPGPLAGILTGLEWAGTQGIDRLVTAPADCPFLPGNLVARLVEATATNNAEIAIARSGDRHHPVIAMWSPALADPLRHCLVNEGIRKIDRFTEQHRTVFVDWPVTDEGDPFDNINTPDDLARAEIRLQG